MKEDVSDAETFFVYGFLGFFSIFFGFLLLIKGISSNGIYGLLGIILIVLGFYFRFKYKIRKKVVHLRKG